MGGADDSRTLPGGRGGRTSSHARTRTNSVLLMKLMNRDVLNNSIKRRHIMVAMAIVLK